MKGGGIRHRNMQIKRDLTFKNSVKKNEKYSLVMNDHEKITRKMLTVEHVFISKVIFSINKLFENSLMCFCCVAAACDQLFFE